MLIFTSDNTNEQGVATENLGHCFLTKPAKEKIKFNSVTQSSIQAWPPGRHTESIYS